MLEWVHGNYVNQVACLGVINLDQLQLSVVRKALAIHTQNGGLVRFFGLVHDGLGELLDLPALGDDPELERGVGLLLQERVFYFFSKVVWEVSPFH
jgi:hypothetical protein